MAPAAGPPTRTQVPQRSSPGALPWVSVPKPVEPLPALGDWPRWKCICTFTRWPRSAVTTASASPTTRALSAAGAVGATGRGGTTGTAASTHSKRFLYVPFSIVPRPSSFAASLPRLLLASCSTASTVNALSARSWLAASAPA